MGHPFSHSRMIQLRDMVCLEEKGELTTAQFKANLSDMGYRVEKFRHHRVLISSINDPTIMRWVGC